MFIVVSVRLIAMQRTAGDGVLVLGPRFVLAYSAAHLSRLATRLNVGGALAAAMFRIGSTSGE